MLKKDFWYDLPKELIAQEPAAPRDAARLMVLSQKDDSIQHKVFRDLPEFLEPGDLLVVNNSKVLPARIVGVKQPTGAVCELLLLRQVKGDQWECLAKPGKRMQPGTKVSFGDGSLILLNETFSTTSFEEGYYIARDSVRAILTKGTRTIYNTHMHKLGFDVDEMNEGRADGKVYSLIVHNEGSQRSYKIEIAPPAGRSYASDIAEKYGVTYDMLVNKEK